MKTGTETAGDAAGVTILGRLLFNGQSAFTPELARYLLGLHFSDEENTKMHDLAVKNQEGRISSEELQELDGYIMAGDLLAILQSKARMTLKKKGR
jgi:hypothetical protein